MAMFEVSVTRLAMADEVSFGNQTVAIFRMSDDGTTDPVLINPPDVVTVASIRRALDHIENMAAVAAGEKPSAVKAK